MFETIKMRNKLKKNGFKITPSESIPMCYRIASLNSRDFVVNDIYIFRAEDGFWNYGPKIKDKKVGTYGSPEFAALWFLSMKGELKVDSNFM